MTTQYLDQSFNNSEFGDSNLVQSSEAELLSGSSVQEEDRKADSLEKLKLLIDLGKFIVGTVLLGVFTTVINAQIQNKQIELEQLKADQAYLSQFVEEAMSDRLVQRIRFAKYFATLTFSEASRERWQDYYIQLDEERIQKEERLHVIYQALPTERERSKNTGDTEILNDLIAEKEALESDVGTIARATTSQEEFWNEEKLRSRIADEAVFTWQDAIATDGTVRIPTSPEVISNIEDMAIKLQAIQDDLGKPIEVVRWYKTPPPNSSVGGASLSRHITGGAVKIRVEGYSGRELAQRLSDWPGGMGVDPETPDLLHLDNRPGRARWGGVR